MRPCEVPGYPQLTRAQFFAPWAFAGQRPFNPAIDGMDVRAAAILGLLAGVALAAFLGILLLLAG